MHGKQLLTVCTIFGSRKGKACFPFRFRHRMFGTLISYRSKRRWNMASTVNKASERRDPPDWSYILFGHNILLGFPFASFPEVCFESRDKQGRHQHVLSNHHIPFLWLTSWNCRSSRSWSLCSTSFSSRRMVLSNCGPLCFSWTSCQREGHLALVFRNRTKKVLNYV